MKIGMVGCGKLGLPVALTIENQGHEVIGYDARPEPYEYVRNRTIPYQEAELQPLLNNTNMEMTRNLGRLVIDSDIIFIAVQTPHDPEYEGATRIPEDRKDFDYTFLKQAVGDVAAKASGLSEPKTVAVISTCLPGTFKREIKPLLNDSVEYVYTPQFIAMGTVMEDYLHPEFNLIGVEDQAAADKLETFYKTINTAPALRTDVTTAEGIKVSYNTFITMKTVLANTWGELSHKLGMNVDDIHKAWSLSSKRLLSPKYLKAGVGDGGGCHPRDNIALSHKAEQMGLSHNIFEDLMAAREAHMSWLAELTTKQAAFHELPIFVLGQSFKPETNITTGSPAVLLKNIIEETDDVTVLTEPRTPEETGVYVVGVQHESYKNCAFPVGSIVIDPFRYIPDQEGVTVIRIGDGTKTNTNQAAV